MLLENDFNTHLYPELIDAISREDDTLLDDAITAAEQEAKGYLSRYDLDTLFAATGTDRDAALMMRLKDMAVWHYIVLANAGTDLELRKTRYDEAIKWLILIQSGKVWYKDWPLPPSYNSEGQGDLFQVTSQPKRDTRY